MSVEAMAYVLPLVECPDGADLSAGMKSILLVLANCHNPHYRIAWPSMPTLATYARLSEDSVRRHVRYMQEHCLIEQRKPENQGSKMKCTYVFLFLDDPKRLQQLLQEKAKGLQGAPLFSPAERVAQGSQSTGQKGSRRVATATRNKEESEPTPKPQSNNMGRAEKPTTPTLDKLPEGLMAKICSVLRAQANATVGMRDDSDTLSPEEKAQRFKAQMLKACDAAGIWKHVARKIGQECYELTLHEATEEINARLESSSYEPADHHA